MGGMGGGAVDEQPRTISIGFKKPKDFLEGDIIYIQISPKDETYTAEAISNFPFNTKYKTTLGHYVPRRAIRATSEEFDDNGRSFIEMLVQDNSGVKEFRLVTDAYHIWDEFKQSPAS
jgi:hypothetical protein